MAFKANKPKGGKVTGKGKGGLAKNMKIKAGGSNEMYGNQKVVAQESGTSSPSQSRSRTSYAK